MILSRNAAFCCASARLSLAMTWRTARESLIASECPRTEICGNFSVGGGVPGSVSEFQIDHRRWWVVFRLPIPRDGLMMARSAPGPRSEHSIELGVSSSSESVLTIKLQNIVCIIIY